MIWVSEKHMVELYHCNIQSCPCGVVLFGGKVEVSKEV